MRQRDARRDWPDAGPRPRRPTARRGRGRCRRWRRRTDVHLRASRTASPTSSRARRSSSSSGGARRSAIVLGEAPSADAASRRSRSSTRVRTTARCCRRSRCALAAWIADALPRAAGARRSGRCCRRACSSGSSSSPSGAGRRRRPRRTWRRRATATCSTQLDAGPAARARPRRAGGPGRAAPAPPRARGARPRRRSTGRCSARGRRTALRALGRADAGRPGGRARRSPRASGRRPAARAAAGGALLDRAGRRAGAGDGLAGRRSSPRATARRARRRRSPGAASSSVEARERPRRPLAGRPAGLRGGRPPAPTLTGAGRRRRPSSERRSRRRDPTPLLLDGVTGGGKTAIYVEAIAASLARGRPALVLVPEIALALPLVDRLRADLDARVALVHSGLSATASGPTSGGGSGPATSTSSSGRGSAVLAPLADVGLVIVDEEHDAGLQERPDAATPGARRGDPARRAGRRGGRPRLGDAVGRQRRPGPRRARIAGVVLPTRPTGAPPAVEVVDLREELAAGNRGLLSRALVDGARGTRHARRGDQAILVSTGAGRRRSSCAATAATSRPARTASGRSSTTRPARRSAATTAAGRRRCATRCPACGSPRIRYLGGGTERVEREVRERFPALRVGAARPRRRRAQGRRRAGPRRVRRRPGSTSSSGRAS